MKPFLFRATTPCRRRPPDGTAPPLAAVLRAVILAVPGLLLATAAGAQDGGLRIGDRDSPAEDCDVEADSGSLHIEPDGSQVFVFEGLTTLCQGWRVEADRATDIDETQRELRLSGNVSISSGFASLTADELILLGRREPRSEWQLAGNVRMQFEGTTLLADRASFVAEGEVLTLAELEGSPARFEHVDPAGGTVSLGSGERIEIDPRAGTMRMPGAARATIRSEGGPDTEFTGCDIAYDIGLGRVTNINSDCGESLRIRRAPQAAGNGDQTP